MTRFPLVLLAVAAAASARAAEPSGKLNVLLLVADDLGYADLGCQGRKDVATPNLDSLAKNGARFTNGYVSAPVCSPSRAGLLTGRYQTRFGHELNPPLADRGEDGLPTAETIAPEFFRRAGYATGHVGKWHLGNSTIKKYNPRSRGFATSVWFPGQNKLPRADGKLPFFRDGERASSKDTYVDEAIGREAADFIARHKRKPWFLYVAFLTPHQPMDLPPGAEAPFAGVADRKRRKFLAAMALLDKGVGRILQALRDTKQEENTLIVFHSDNGAEPGNGSLNAPLAGWKSTTHEGGLRVPFLIQWKAKVPAGRVIDHPVITLDVLPTALAAADVKAKPAKPFDGVDLLPWLTGKPAAAPHAALFWRYGDQWAVRSGDWKLVNARRARTEPLKVGLYNLKTDPGEAKDLSEAQPRTAARLKAAYQTWNKEQAKPLWGAEKPAP